MFQTLLPEPQRTNNASQRYSNHHTILHTLNAAQRGVVRIGGTSETPAPAEYAANRACPLCIPGRSRTP
eukprot:9504141-Pyramimonas_sp.AAC.1